MNKVLRSGFVLASTCASFWIVNNVNALTYQDGTPVQFTFNSTLSITLSDTDIVIGNLIPGQDDTSNAVDVVVNTNNLYGYTLTATVGSATKDYRDLRHTNGTASFASIDVDSDLSTLSGQSSSVWGYTTSTNGTTWSNFNGLPKYDDTTNTAELNVTDGAAADSTTSFKIGAFAAEGQLAGDYTNVINFIVISNGAPHQPTMQEITTATCPSEATTVVDARDGKEYTIQLMTTYYDTTLCWMTSDLEIAGGTPLYSDDSNVPDGYPFSGGAPFYTLPSSSTNGFDDPAVANVYNSNSTICGDNSPCYSYYNFSAATAGTNPGVGDNPHDVYAEYDICPKGWRLPTSDELNSLGLDVVTTAPWNGSRTGLYHNGVFQGGGDTGCYWSSRAYTASYAYSLSFDSDAAIIVGDEKKDGIAIRCVAK